MQLERVIERGVEASSDDGSFSAIVATEGEASDGHILSIRGLETSPEKPMLFGHYSSEQIPLVGTWRNPVKRAGVMRKQGHINMNGDGIMSEVRRGLAQLVIDGDLKGVSIRADAKKVTPRANLSKDHPAYIDSAKVERNDPRARGMFIEKSVDIESSLVAIGADPAALIGRADGTSNEHVQTFFRSLGDQAEAHGTSELTTAFTALRESLTSVKELGVDDHELAELLGGETMRDCIDYEYTDDEGSLQSARISTGVYRALVGESRSAYRGALALHAEFERNLAAHNTANETELTERVKRAEAKSLESGKVTRQQVDAFHDAIAKRFRQAQGKLR